MQISVTLLLCTFCLCCTGLANRFSAKLRLPAGRIAAGSLLLAAASVFDIPLASRLSVNVASMLCVAIFFLLCRKQRGTSLAVPLAFLCGVLAWLAQRIVPGFPEPGLIVAMPAVLLSALFPLNARQRCLCLSLAPLFFGLTNALEEWYLFDVASFYLGSAAQLNMQIIGIFLLGILSSMAPDKMKKHFDMQKEY